MRTKKTCYGCCARNWECKYEELENSCMLGHKQIVYDGEPEPVRPCPRPVKKEKFYLLLIEEKNRTIERLEYTITALLEK